jgi:hypothetical protein
MEEWAPYQQTLSSTWKISHETNQSFIMQILSKLLVFWYEVSQQKKIHSWSIISGIS